MKARISINNKLSNNEKRTIQEYVSREREHQSKELTRRIIKITCIALNREFGFGAKRLTRLVDAITTTAADNKQDELYWYHVDQIIKDELGLEFELEDYDKLDRG